MRRLSAMLHRSTLLQLLLILACWGACEALVRWLGLRLPGSIMAMGLLIALLLGRVLRPQSLRRGARVLLADMLVFFVPAVPAVLDHPEFMGWMGVKIVAVIAMGTIIVMATTAMTVELACRWGGLDDI